MIRAAIGPGEDVEAWCTRCRMNLNHRVIAVVGSSIHRVHCLTCGGDHKYYPPKSVTPGVTEKTRSKSPASATTPAAKDRKASERAAGKAYSEWVTFMKAMPEGTLPRQYSTKESFKAGDYVEHPEFGTGRVVDVLGAERIEVAFKDSRKVMVCNRGTTA
jgi:hypothetical protein